MTRRRCSIGPVWFIQQPRHMAGWGAVDLRIGIKTLFLLPMLVDRVTELGSETSLAPLQWFLPPTGCVEEQEARWTWGEVEAECVGEQLALSPSRKLPNCTQSDLPQWTLLRR